MQGESESRAEVTGYMFLSFIHGARIVESGSYMSLSAQ